MGLDAVELVMDVEEAFDVQISDDEASRVVTVGDLYDLLRRQVRVAAADDVRRCLSAVTFFRIRRAIVDELAVGPKALRPRTSLADAIPATRRRAVWSHLAKQLDWKLPALNRSALLFRICLTAIGCIAVASLAAAVYFGNHFGNRGLHIAAALAVTFGSALLLDAITKPYRIHPSPHFATLRGLAETVLAMNYAAIARQAHGLEANERIEWSPNDVWNTLCTIIAEQLNVDRAKLRRETSFVNDLRCD